MKKILVISSQDISNPNTLSGTSFFIIKNLKMISNVEILDKLKPLRKDLFKLSNFDFLWRFFIAKSLESIFRLFKKKYNWEGCYLIVAYYTKKISQFLEINDSFNYILSDKGSCVIGLLKTKIPLLYLSDATVKLMIDYYPEFTNLPKYHRNFLDLLEENCIRTAKKCIYRSEWAANSAITNYNKNKNDVSFFSLGPNIPEEFLLTNIDNCITTKLNNTPLIFLLIGVDWERKGCSDAIEVIKILNTKGIQSELKICGVSAPNNFKTPHFVKIVPYIQKRNADDFKKFTDLYRSANYFIFPTKAECLGISIIEAMSFGCPILTTPTGGIPEIVSKENGCLSNNLLDFVSYIENLKNNPHEYKQACLKSYQIYKEKTSWDIWRNKMSKIIEN